MEILVRYGQIHQQHIGMIMVKFQFLDLVVAQQATVLIHKLPMLCVLDQIIEGSIKY